MPLPSNRASPVADLDREREPGQGGDPGQVPQLVHHQGPSRVGGQLFDPGVEPVPAGGGGQHLIQVLLDGEVQVCIVEPLPRQPRQVAAGPGVPVAVHGPMAQQQLRQPVPGPHQIGPAVLPAPDQVPGRLCRGVGHRDRCELAQPQQSAQKLGVPGIGLGNTSPVSSSIPCAATERACTSSPTLVRSVKHRGLPALCPVVYLGAMFDRSRGVLFPSRLPAFHRFAPPQSVAELVQWFWIPEWDLEPGVVSRQTVVSYPALNLVVEPHGVSLVGATTRMTERMLRGSGWAVGALLRPAVVRTLTVNPSSLVDTEQPVDAPALHAQVVAVMGCARERHEKAVDSFARWLSARTCDVPSDARRANTMLEVLIGEGGANTPTEAAVRLAVSLRTLQRMTHRYIGLPPAAIIRRRRLQDAARQVRERPDVSLAAIAADLGYTDHAHLTGDFRSALGFTPSDYRTESS